MKEKKERHLWHWDNTWVTLWLVTLANHNVTRVQRNKKILWKRKKKDTCGIEIILGWHCGWWHWPTTMSHVYKETKKYYERERRKTLVALWLANVTMSPTTMSPKCYPVLSMQGSTWVTLWHWPTTMSPNHNVTSSTWVTLWLVTLANHNVTRVQRNKKILWKRKKKDTCGIVVDQCQNVTQVLPVMQTKQK